MHVPGGAVGLAWSGTQRSVPRHQALPPVRTSMLTVAVQYASGFQVSSTSSTCRAAVSMGGSITDIGWAMATTSLVPGKDGVMHGG